jgi:peptide/nickel transport system substrate-binding protein
MAFREAPAPAGYTVRPEAAVGAPKISRDGRTYVFTVRKGLRFSDGSPLTAANFAHALGRVVNPAMRSEGAAFFADVKAATARGRQLMIELRRPSAGLLTRLALPYACPVPLGLPVDPAGVELRVGSGPYYIARYETGRLLVLEQNRLYRGDRPRRSERVVLTIGDDLEESIRTVEEGRADVLATELPTDFRLALAAHYGVDKRQFFRIRGTSITTLVFNTSRPLFRGNAALRRAINLAVDRTSIVRAATGWPVLRLPTDQILTRWLAGWVDHRLYPMRPNLESARRLAAGNLRVGKAILWTTPGRGSLDAAEIIARNLLEIGLDVEVKALSSEVMNATASTRGAPYDMLLGSFPLIYPDPATLVIRLLGGENARKPANNSNYSYFDAPRYNRRMAAADGLSGAARSRAFSQLDADLMRNEAPWAPLYEFSSSLFVSERVGCVPVHPVFRIDVGAMCLR